MGRSVSFPGCSDDMMALHDASRVLAGPRPGEKASRDLGAEEAVARMAERYDMVGRMSSAPRVPIAPRVAFRPAGAVVTPRLGLDEASVKDDDEDDETGSVPDLPGQNDNGFESGRWSMAEHKRFVEGLKLYGRRKWIRIAEHVGTRTVIQVRSHAQKYFKKLRKDEDDVAGAPLVCPRPRAPAPAFCYGNPPVGPWLPVPAPVLAPPGLALLVTAAHAIEDGTPSRDDEATVRVDRDDASRASSDDLIAARDHDASDTTNLTKRPRVF